VGVVHQQDVKTSWKSVSKVTKICAASAVRGTPGERSFKEKEKGSGIAEETKGGQKYRKQSEDARGLAGRRENRQRPGGGWVVKEQNLLLNLSAKDIGSTEGTVGKSAENDRSSGGAFSVLRVVSMKEANKGE